MSISSVTNSNISLASVFSNTAGQGVNSSTPSTSGASVSSAPVGGGHHRHHHGGGMDSAITQALQQIGLTSSTSQISPTSQTSSGTNSDSGSTAGAAAAVGNVKNDIQNLVQQLAAALQSAGSSNTTSIGANSAGQVGDLASNLSTVISEASNGQAPAGLQTAFDSLAQDLQGASSSATASTNTPSLQQFLTTLQQKLGDLRNNSGAFYSQKA